jgi:hypothetical protein
MKPGVRRKAHRPNRNSVSDEAQRSEPALYDQAGVQKVIDRLTAMKALLPEKVQKEEGDLKSTSLG